MGKITENKLIGKIFLVLFLVLMNSSGFSQIAVTNSSMTALVQGYNSYRDGDWSSTALFLRKAVSDDSVANAEAWYMLITSDMYSCDYSSAVLDSDHFLQFYPDHNLVGNVEYQKGRALHFLGQNDGAVLALSDFCHEYPDSDLYPSALYWIAECFYDDYNYDTAREMYQQIIEMYPDDAKVEDCRYRLDMIAQKDREQKLLYLLKMTGEEYLNTRESYERQLRQYQTEDMIEVRRQLEAALERIKELEEGSVKVVPTSSTIIETDVQDTLVVEETAEERQKREALENLKRKASQLQQVLE